MCIRDRATVVPVVLPESRGDQAVESECQIPLVKAYKNPLILFLPIQELMVMEVMVVLNHMVLVAVVLPRMEVLDHKVKEVTEEIVVPLMMDHLLDIHH